MAERGRMGDSVCRRQEVGEIWEKHIMPRCIGVPHSSPRAPGGLPMSATKKVTGQSFNIIQGEPKNEPQYYYNAFSVAQNSNKSKEQGGAWNNHKIDKASAFRFDNLVDNVYTEAETINGKNWKRIRPATPRKPPGLISLEVRSSNFQEQFEPHSTDDAIQVRPDLESFGLISITDRVRFEVFEPSKSCNTPVHYCPRIYLRQKNPFESPKIGKTPIVAHHKGPQVTPHNWTCLNNPPLLCRPRITNSQGASCVYFQARNTASAHARRGSVEPAPTAIDAEGVRAVTARGGASEALG
ncbi:hypothetical protein EDC01DRAFT_746941 [Geopyxis carbonaria]|nr:hypothetical protein EDC01DRAFT_746941 [Geopyxis carbonaria]